MPDVIINGPEGRLEGRYLHAKDPSAPVAIVLHPHPQHGGTMNNKVVYNLFHTFAKQGFSGRFSLSDAASALDWLQSVNQSARGCWVAGFSFGAWIGMQLLMRRPEIEGFISISPPANMYDFTFLAPCPSSGLIVQGDKDSIVQEPSVAKLVTKLQTQRGIEIDYRVVPGAEHFYKDEMDQLCGHVADYLQKARAQTAE